jgi:Trk K+ transport system NAD-binding subunit
MKAIIVGSGGTTRELLRRLGGLWEVTVVDLDKVRLDATSEVRVFEAVVGDGSSQLILERAGIDDADALVAASEDDDRNLAAVKIALDKGLLRVTAVASDPSRLADYRALDVPVFAPDLLTARHVELAMEPRRVASTAFAQGKAEAMEFVISPDSPVHGKRLRQLHSNTWTVAAVLRGDDLIVPHGGTELLAGDRVTVVGAAADFVGIVNTFTSGLSRFPLNFGRKVAVALNNETDLDLTVSEALSIVRNSQAEALMVVHRDLARARDEGSAEIGDLIEKLESQADGVEIDLRPVDGAPADSLVRLSGSESVGLIAVPAPQRTGFVGRVQASRIVTTYGRAGLPLLLCRGSHPYSSMLVPARRTSSGEAAGRAAIDLARTSGATLIGIAVIPPAFVSSPQVIADARESAGWLREEAAVQGVHVRRKLARGNPVREIERIAAGASLAVLGLPDLPMSWIRPGIAGHLLGRLGSSVLLIPSST